ncbi:MAG: hypothetical protein BWY14_00782 [Parcubacteria group bacterium ADurb.Bin192]|nr:MAG: hypothetical protein BWY14_00782 [Parcubacteria group bacterium ADurb.Bin192]
MAPQTRGHFFSPFQLRGGQPMYADSMEAAVQEIMRRRAQPGLLERMDGFLHDFPFPFDRPFLTIARHVASARMEDMTFLDMSRRADLPPVWFTYNQDKFCFSNREKRQLVESRVAERQGRKGGYTGPGFCLMDSPKRHDGQPLNRLSTRHGVALAQFHRQLRSAAGLDQYTLLDISDWLHARGGRAEVYYKPLLALFLAHAVMVEDFETAGTFKCHIVERAITELKRDYGLEPLIVRLPTTPFDGWYHASCQPVLRQAGFIV